MLMADVETYDVIVVGSGSAGAMAGLRAHELGLSVLIVEKAHKYGGTSAASGGVIWIPNHGLCTGDSREQALQYLTGITRGNIQRDRLEAYVDQAREMVRFLAAQGIAPIVATRPDYYPDHSGARSDRSLVFGTFDGRELGERFTLMREQFTRFKLLNRYAMDLSEFFALSARSPGWRRTFLAVLRRYWLDTGTRRISARDRRFTSGAALMGPIFKRVFLNGIEVRLETKLEELLTTDGKVTGVTVSNFGRRYAISAR